MKNGKRLIGWCLALAWAVGMGTGCGAIQGSQREELATSEPGTLSYPSEVAGNALGLRILTAGEGDPELPDRLADLQGERIHDAILASGNEIEFRDNIQLAGFRGRDGKPKPLFLVWANRFQGAEIQSAHVEHRIYNEVNELVGEPKRWAALYDAVTHRWYLRLSEFFEGDGSQEHAGRQHTLLLDLMLASGARQLIFVRFRAVGPIPKLEVSALEPDTASLTSGRIPKDGLEFMGHRLKNPTKRQLKVWFKGTGAQSLLSFSLLVSHIHYEEVGEVYYRLAPPREVTDLFHVSGELMVSRVRVLNKKSGDSKTTLLVENAWSDVLLEPEEELELNWIARPVSPQCTLPPPVTRNYTWVDLNVPPNCGIWCTKNVSQTFTERWQIGSVGWQGGWGAELRVSLPWEPVEQSIALTSSPWKPAVGPSFDPKAYRAYSCQGAF